MTLTEEAAIVLQEIAAALALAEKATKGPWRVQAEAVYANTGSRSEPIMRFHPSAQHHLDNTFIATSRTLLPTSLRCLKTAIERGIYEMEHFPNNWCENTLRDILDQWEAGK